MEESWEAKWGEVREREEKEEVVSEEVLVDMEDEDNSEVVRVTFSNL